MNQRKLLANIRANKEIIIVLAIVLAVLIYYYMRPSKYRIEEPNEKAERTAFGGEATKDYPYPYTGLPETKNFKINEFHCKCGEVVPVIYYGNLQVLMNNLQILREAVGAPITINSGYRTPDYNKRVGGATSSMHLRAKAADIRISGMTPTQVYKRIKEMIDAGQMQDGGLSEYKTFVHYDVGRPRRW